MAGLKTSGTVLITVPGHGTIKITPHGGRKLSIAAPQSLDILDRKARRIDLRRKNPRTGRR